jgi:NADPH-dependent curcumin reductase CurA
MNNSNRRFVLKTRPTGIAKPENFAEEIVAIRKPDEGEILLETLLLSVDPAMRVWISENPGYVPPVKIGETMRGGGIARVIESRTDRFSPGDIVQASTGWQSHPTLPATGIEKLDLALGGPLDWIGLLGMTGLTAYFGMRDIAAVRPGETVLVSAAAGGVGQVAGQIGKIEACRVVGIAGGAEKCRRLTAELGFDAAIDYRAEADLAAAIARTCPNGVDVFYDNVGGATLEAAIANLRLGARVVICGRISQTAGGEPYGVRNLGLLIGKRARIRGLGVPDFAERYPEARIWLASQAKLGRLRQHVHVIDGLESAPVGLGMLFRGENNGKLAVRVTE